MGIRSWPWPPSGKLPEDLVEREALLSSIKEIGEKARDLQETLLADDSSGNESQSNIDAGG